MIVIHHVTCMLPVVCFLDGVDHNDRLIFLKKHLFTHFLSEASVQLITQV